MFFFTFKETNKFFFVILLKFSYLCKMESAILMDSYPTDQITALNIF